MAIDTEEKGFEAATFKGLSVVSFQAKWKSVWYTLVCFSFLWISRAKKAK